MNPNLDKIGQLATDLLSEVSRLSLKERTDKYIELVKTRNGLARDNGFLNYLGMQIEKIHKVPNDDWDNYLSKRSSLSRDFISCTDSSESYPHFLSKLPKSSLSFPDGVFSLDTNFGDFRNKIDLAIQGEESLFKYHSDTNRYEINIADVSHNQKIAMLIHELSHVIDQENKNHKIDSIYESEMSALELEFQIAKSISDEFFIADAREYLVCLVRTEFELLIISNPDQSPSLLFASILKKYYGDFDANGSYLFLTDKKIIMKPLSDLSVAVTLTNLLPD
jgi:hypothetical protein